MKMHIGVDKARGIIHRVITTPANFHDATKADELRRPYDWVIGGSGYLGMEKRDSANPERVIYTAAKRYSQRKKLSAERIADEKLLSSIRCKVEHAFHRINVAGYGLGTTFSVPRNKLRFFKFGLPSQLLISRDRLALQFSRFFSLFPC